MKSKMMANKNLQHLLLSLCILSLTCTTVTAIHTPPAYAAVTPIVYLDGNKITFLDAKPYIDAQGRTQIPIRFIAEKMKYNVQYNNETQAVTIKKSGKTISLQIGSSIMKVSGSKDTIMDTSVIINEGRTYVPIRYVAEAFNAKVEYNAQTHIVKIILS